jgi:kexin
VGENDCSDRHGGTSAAAPNAAGIFALVLSVRPELTWRDLQYLCVQTAVPVKTSDSDWKKLPSGRIYNHKFGYGKLDAGALVEAAKDFKLVNQQTWVELSSPSKPIAIPDSSDVKTKKALKSALLVTADMVKAAGLLRLEHVTATVNIEHERRGNVVVNLESPNNVISELATKRNLDKSKDGIVNWRFMSVKHWEEDPVGNWTLNVYDVDHPEATGTFLNWTLSLFGEMDPDFKGTPIHTSTGQHDIKETSVTHVPTPTHTPTKDNTPSRPTKNKKPPTTTVSQSSSTDAKPSDTPITHENESELDSAKSGSDEALSETSSSASTVAYVIVGSISIFCLATALYFYKRKGWQVVSTDGQPSRQTRGDGYEFDVLQPLTGIDEESEEEDDDDDTHRHATR